MSEAVNIIVTGSGGQGFGSCIFKALSYSSLKFRLIACDANPYLIHTTPAEIRELIPTVADEEVYLKALKAVVDKYSAHCVFVGSEPEIVAFARNENRWREVLGIEVISNSGSVVELGKNKFDCASFLKDKGFRVPESILLESKQDFHLIEKFPQILKPNYLSGRSSHVHLVESREELESLGRYLLGRGVNLVAQEYIPFNENEYTVGVTTDPFTGEVLGTIALKKFMLGVTRLVQFGDKVISSGCTQGVVDAPEVRKQCAEIAKAMDSRGPMNVQLRFVDGQVVPFEINPRLSGTTAARALNGYNEPEFYVRHLILEDTDAVSSLDSTPRGYLVRGLDERFVPFVFP